MTCLLSVAHVLLSERFSKIAYNTVPLLKQCSRSDQSRSSQRPQVRSFRRERRGQRIRIQAAAAAVDDDIDVSKGPDLWNRTYYPKAVHADNSTKPWFIIDAEGKRLGRLATLAAAKIRGKTRAEFTPSMDMGGYVIVINADKVVVSGDKASQKMYYRHSGRPGSLKSENFLHLQARIPERIVERAVKGMLPKGRLGRSLFNHLKVFKGPSHPHQAQQPQDITSIINAKPDALGELQ